MRKTREVVRLRALELKLHQISRSCSIVQSTVCKYRVSASFLKTSKFRYFFTFGFEFGFVS